MTYRNQDYLNRELSKMDDFKAKIKAEIKFYEEFIAVADGSKKIFKTFEGKIPTKRIETALKNFNKHLYFRPREYFYGEWEMDFYKDYHHQRKIFYGVKIADRVVFEDIENEINKTIEYTQKSIDELKAFLKNPESKIKKLYKMADDFNEVYDSIPSQAKEIIGIKHVFVYL